MPFEFATANRILFGEGVLINVGPEAAALGQRAFVITGVPADCCGSLLDVLRAEDVTFRLFSVDHEPTIHSIQRAVQLARDFAAQVIIGFGGGSALDTGKAVAALLANPGDLYDYLEVIGAGRILALQPLPYIAIPTTAGTGAEVTRNAVIGSPEHQVKVSLRSPLMLPRLALVDPKLTYHLPASVTASTGLDALTQLIEPYVSNAANPLTDALCAQGIPRAALALPIAYHNGLNAGARREMALCSLYGGMALANARLGAVHGFAGPLGGMLPGPHGAICARLLPYVMEANIRALQARLPDSQALERYRQVAIWLTGNPLARPLDGARWVAELCSELAIPSLSTYGLQVEHFNDAIEKASQASSMKGNPVQLQHAELVGILEQAL